jgi:large subunit ribosomal protein L14
MIQSGSYINIIDNSGAKQVKCIKVLKGYKSRYAHVGDLVIVSVKDLRSTRRTSSKIKKGEVHRVLIVRTKKLTKNFNFDQFGFFENSGILLSKQNVCLGTRIFGSIPRMFRYTKYLKIVSVSSGLIS